MSESRSSTSRWTREGVRTQMRRRAEEQAKVGRYPFEGRFATRQEIESLLNDRQKAHLRIVFELALLFAGVLTAAVLVLVVTFVIAY